MATKPIKKHIRPCMEEVEILLSSRRECIWITTYEEDAVIRDLTEIIAKSLRNMKLKVWSYTEGLKSIPVVRGERPEAADVKLREVPALFAYMRAQLQENDGNQTIYVLRDLHNLMSDPRTRRCIRDMKEYFQNVYMPIIVISPEKEINDEVSRLFRVVQYDLPDKKLIRELVQAANIRIKNSIQQGKTQYKAIEEDEYDAFVNALVGLTELEITNLLVESTIRHLTLDLQFVLNDKIEAVKKSGALGWKTPRITLDDVGGHNAIKKWLHEITMMYSPAAVELGLPQPKGAVLLGLPGNGKTMLAEALAGELGIPLLTLDLDKILSRMVGASESNMRRALDIVKASAPSCLLIDELEKSLGGISSSNASDSGIVARVFQELLTFLQDNNGVFVCMTSNDVSQLPPELTRAGRLDAIWFFDNPDKEARAEIFKIHFGKYGYQEIPEEFLESMVNATNNFTGAEIEEVVKTVIRKSFIRGLESEDNAEITEELILEAISEVIPIYQSSREKLTRLQEFCRGRARFTDGSDKHSSKSQDNLDILEF